MDPLPQHSAYTFIPYTIPFPIPQPSLKIRHPSTYTYCGPLLTPSTLPPSLHPWLSQTTTSPSALLSHLTPLLLFLHAFLSEAGVQHYWLTLRCTGPTNEYDTPRWHVDDDFFAAGLSPRDEVETGRRPGNVFKTQKKNKEKKEGQYGPAWKLCTTLLGPPTLFLPPSLNPSALHTLTTTQQQLRAQRDHACTSIRCLACFATNDTVRHILAAAFARETVVQAKDGEVAVFRTGSERGAVHSEPRCGEDRVFVNVVPGTEEGLRGLMGRFGMGFPRAWSLGLPASQDYEGEQEMREDGGVDV